MKAPASGVAGSSGLRRARVGACRSSRYGCPELPSINRGGAVFQAVNYLAVRDGPWKLIPGLGSGGFISTPSTRDPGPGEPDGQLYHLDDDPAEQNNLYDDRPQVVDRLMDKLRRYRQQQPE